MVSCTDDDDKDPNFMPPDIVMGGGDVESEYPEDLPAPAIYAIIRVFSVFQLDIGG